MKKFERFKTAVEVTIPEIYDTVGKVIRFGYTEETKQNEEGEDETVYVGYNIPLTGHIDYGHIKSQIIDHVYAQKDVFAIINNALAELMIERAGGEADETHIAEFAELEEWRAIAAGAAKELVSKFK